MSVGYHNNDAEQCVLGSILLRGHVLDGVADLQRADFFNPRHAAIWSACVALEARGEPVDVITLEGELGDRVAAIGGLVYLAELALKVPTAENVVYYGDLVRKHALTRRILHVLTNALLDAKTGRLEANELLASAESKLATLATGQRSTTRCMREMVKSLLAEIEDAYEARQRGEFVVRGVPTGIEKWDDMGGIHRGIVSVLAGRPSMGKTAVAQAVTQAAVEKGYGVHVFSLEDPWQSYVSRAMARDSRVALTRIRGARLERGDMTRLTGAMGRLCQWKRFGYDDIGTTAGRVVSAVRRERDKLETSLVVVDYLQRMRKPDPRMSTQEGLEANITTFAEAAIADDMAYLVLSQLSRKTEGRSDKRPEMEDMRGAGEIEERAKTMIAAYRPGFYDDEHADDEIELLVIKNNDGPRGIIKCRWDGECTRIY